MPVNSNRLKSSLTVSHENLDLVPLFHCQEVTCELVPQDNILIGSGFTVSVILANTGTFQRTVVGQLSCHSVTYTGIRVQNIKIVNLQATIAPKRGM